MAIRGTGTTAAKATALKNLGDDGEDKAIVETVKTETTTYQKPVREINDENKGKDKDTGGQNNNAGSFTDNFKANETSFENKTSAPSNRLADMFSDLADYEQEDGEQFMCLITRRADMLQDNFRKPLTLTAQQFPPLPITSQMFMQFIQLIQKYNGNSGGRFDISICEANGESLDIGLSNFVIADPIIADTLQQDGRSNEIDIVAILKEQNEQSDKRFAQMLDAMRPKEDEFITLAKEKLRNDILNPPQPQQNQFNPEQMITGIMSSMAVTSAMAEGFAGMFNKNTPTEEKKSLVESLLTNELFMDRASEFGSNLVEKASELAIAFKNPQAYVAAKQAEVYDYDDGEPNPPLGSGVDPNNLSEEQKQSMERGKQVVSDILSEIESDRVLDEKNETILKLKDEYKDIYPMLKMACVSMPFERVLAELQALAPEAFADFVDENNALNERGEKAKVRLLEFYNFLKTA